MSHFRRTLIWTVMLAGCSSQPFCEFHDTAPILVLPTDDDTSAGDGYGINMIAFTVTEQDGVVRDYVAANGGPGSQTDAYRLAEDGAISVARSATLAEICDREETDDTESTCHERSAGSALAFRSEWNNDGYQCLAVGMAGNDLGPGVGFWCNEGMNHLRGGSYFRAFNSPVQAMAHIDDPTERLFVGTSNSFHLLDGDTESFVEIEWTGTGLPSTTNSIEALSTLDVSDQPQGYLVAAGMPDNRMVLIGSVVSPGTPGDNATLIPRACIAVDEPGFGSTIELARLEPNGDPMLLAGSKWGIHNRSDAVYIFDIDLDVDPVDVECLTPSPVHTLECGNIDGVDADCSVNDSGFGTAFAIGDLDDTDEFEVVVGSPGARSEGYDRAGAVYIFRPARDGAELQNVLIDSGEDRGQFRLGEGVAIVLVGDRNELIVASPGEIGLLVFFCSGVGDNPPLWDKPTNRGNSLEDARCRNPER